MNNKIKNKFIFNNELKSYIIGFLFSLFLTGIPFYLATQKKIFTLKIYFFIFVIFAIFQIFIHLKYFLHFNFSKEYFWNIIFLIFTILIACIIFLGSTWIMYNLNHNLMSN